MLRFSVWSVHLWILCEYLIVKIHARYLILQQIWISITENLVSAQYCDTPENQSVTMHEMCDPNCYSAFHYCFDLIMVELEWQNLHKKASESVAMLDLSRRFQLFKNVSSVWPNWLSIWSSEQTMISDSIGFSHPECFPYVWSYLKALNAGQPILRKMAGIHWIQTHYSQFSIYDTSFTIQ